MFSVSRRRPGRGTRSPWVGAAAITPVAIAYAVVLAVVPTDAMYTFAMAGAVPILLAAWAYGITGAIVGTTLIAAVDLAVVVGVRGVPLAVAAGAGAPVGLTLTLIVGVLVGKLRAVSGTLQRERRLLLRTMEATIHTLAYQAELRDFSTGQHLDRTARYVQILATELARDPEYRRYITREYITDLVRAAPLHDIGKVGIPDAVLVKPGKLSDSEFAIMKEHCDLGVRVLVRAQQRIGFESFLTIAIQIAGAHHEKWNGAGYPRGGSGSDIPLSGRIMAVADVYDAMRTERVYKPGFPHEQVVGRIVMERGAHFDPDIVDAFISAEHRFALVAEAMGDPVDDAADLEELAGA